MKNVIAIAHRHLRWPEIGDNQAALITRGLAEISRLVLSLLRDLFRSYRSGDLITTCIILRTQSLGW